MATSKKTWDLDSFDGGLDLRAGLFARRQNRLRIGHNVLLRATDTGAYIDRRSPCVDLGDGGTFDSQTQGLIEIDGQKFTFAPKGATIVNTGDVDSSTQILEFDVPDLCGTGWELVHSKVFDGYAVAWIRHDFPSETYPNLLVWHVWDGLIYAPTFCQDPYLPGSFSPTILDIGESQVYDASFDPVVGTGATKVWTGTIAGNAIASRTADPRVWNGLSVDALKDDGETYAFVIPEGAGEYRDLIIPRPYDDLKGLEFWAYYTLERANGSTWDTVTEDASADTPALGAYSASSIASRFAGGPNEIRIRIRWDSSDAGIVRFRLVAGATAIEFVDPPTIAGEQFGAVFAIRIGGATYRYDLGEEQTTAPSWMSLAGFTEFLVKIRSGSASAEITTDLANKELSHLSRKERITHRVKIPARAADELNAMVKCQYWRSGAWTACAGTVSVTATDTTIVGVGTAFTTELLIGQTVRVGGTELNGIAEIDTNTLVNDTSTAWVGTQAGVALERDVGLYSIFQDGKTKIYLGNWSGNAWTVGETVTINSVTYTISAIETVIHYKTPSSTTLGTILVLLKDGEHGDYTAALVSNYNVISTGRPIITPFEYAFETADSDWYNALSLEYTDLAGDGDTILINTSSQDNTGGKITAIHAVKRRLLITYSGSAQLWEIDQDTNATRWLETINLGTGNQQWPSPVTFFGSVFLPTVNSWRAFSAVGNLLDNLDASNLGEALEGLSMPTVRAAAYWAQFGIMVMATEVDDVTTFYVLSYSREGKLTAWQTWSVAGMGRVIPETLHASGDKLFFRTDANRLLAFDAGSTEYADLDEAEGEEYESDCLFFYNDFGRPGLNKRFTGMDLVQEGSCTVAFQVIPYGATSETNTVETNPVPVDGQTYGFARLGMMLKAPSIAPRLRSQSRTGWKLHRIAIDYLLLKR